MSTDPVQHQRQLVERLQEGGPLGLSRDAVELIETHISWVILAGDYAYKVKKGVDFGFLDYSTLEKRRTWCEEELRLNRRTAPALYLALITVGGTLEAPVIGGEPAIEYMVKMRRFPQSALLSEQLQAGRVTPQLIEATATAMAQFHDGVERADPASPFGSPASVWHPVNENFEQIAERITNPVQRQRLAVIAEQSHTLFQRQQPLIAARKAAGRVRDCHGDLHLNNIVLLDGHPLPFDCIEFNPSLRIIDTISEVAFLVMDLEEHGYPALASLLLNRYLEWNGDYEGVALLPFYLAYRAMVRAKVAILRLDQPGLDATAQASVKREFTDYLALAEHYLRLRRPRLLITHGLSGSGKSRVSRELLQQIGAIRLRSDIERKRLFGLAADGDSGSRLDSDIYTAEASRRTYQRLAELAEAVAAGGYSVIVDATFLQREARDHFRALAERLGIPCTLLLFQADAATLRQRVGQRHAEGSDPSEADLAVLEAQLARYTPPSDEELAGAIAVDTSQPPEAAAAAIAAQLAEGG